MKLYQGLRVFVLSAAAACAEGAPTHVDPIAFWNFEGRLSWGLVGPTEQAIRTQNGLRTLWAQIHTTPASDRRRVPTAPEVDFAREMIIAVGLGRRSTGGYGIRVERIEDVGDHLRVIYSSSSPGPNCIVTQSITSPVALVRLKKSPKPITFAAVYETRDCPR
jgi:hypothetical protein